MQTVPFQSFGHSEINDSALRCLYVIYSEFGWTAHARLNRDRPMDSPLFRN